MIKDRAHQETRMKQLASNTDHINNRFGAQIVGLMMGISGVKYSGSYGANLFGTSSTHAAPLNNNTAVAF